MKTRHAEENMVDQLYKKQDTAFYWGVLFGVLLLACCISFPSLHSSLDSPEILKYLTKSGLKNWLFGGLAITGAGSLGGLIYNYTKFSKLGKLISREKENLQMLNEHIKTAKTISKNLDPKEINKNTTRININSKELNTGNISSKIKKHLITTNQLVKTLNKNTHFNPGASSSTSRCWRKKK